MDAKNEKTGANPLLGPQWKGFHQAYDSALRTYRRGPDVSRAVNWLYVSSREGASAEELESERRYRELGLNAAAGAESEVELAPRVWRALKTSDEGRAEEPIGPEIVFPGPSGELPGGDPEAPKGGEEEKPAPDEKRDPAWEFIL